jgi:hypothetical protein
VTPSIPWTQLIEAAKIIGALIAVLTVVYKMGKVGQKIDSMASGIGKLTDRLETHLDWHLDNVPNNRNQVFGPQQHVREAEPRGAEPAPGPARKQDTVPYLNIPYRPLP